MQPRVSIEAGVLAMTRMSETRTIWLPPLSEGC